MHQQYWRKAHGRAFEAATHTLGLESRSRVVIAVLLTVIALAAIWFLGGTPGHEVAMHEIILRVALTGAVILAFPFVYGFHLCRAPPRMAAETDEELERLKGELHAATAGKASPEITRDWPIDELFSHIDPHILEDGAALDKWRIVGTRIRDEFATGRLKVWGRPVRDDLGKMLGETPALCPIDPKYWYFSHFTFHFFDSTADGQPHTYVEPGHSEPDYTDLRVSREEALAIWPGEPADIAEHYPNVRVADSPATLELFNGPERPKLISLLNAEKIFAWAAISSSVSVDLVKLEGKIWNTHSFRFDPKRGDGAINQTFLRPRGTINSTHYDVFFNYAQLKRVWPDLSIRRTTGRVL
jgi:hypothetical protein